MTDTKRDESRDMAIVWCWEHSETSGDTCASPADECSAWGNPDNSPDAERFVPHSHLLAETERADMAEAELVRFVKYITEDEAKTRRGVTRLPRLVEEVSKRLGIGAKP